MTFPCAYCTKTFGDELGQRVHQYKCDPNPDMYIQAWKSTAFKTGFYRDDPYY